MIVLPLLFTAHPSLHPARFRFNLLNANGFMYVPQGILCKYPVFGLAQYQPEKQTEEEAVEEDEAAFKNRKKTAMEVPVQLVSTVRELIAKYQALKHE